MKHLVISIAIAMTGIAAPAAGARDFVHPGSLYSQGDLDRMRAMVEAGREPYASTFERLKTSGYTKYVDRNRGSQIKEGKFNQTVGEDGRRAHDLALMWHITGDEDYARAVVKILNFSSYYTNTSSRGTGPLDNGKIWLLLEAAELMRDYPGWSYDDRERFKAMLVHPGYSNTAAPDAHYSLDDDLNDVTFYWNIYNFDASRFGNQGLFAARAMMAMGVFLDNELIYDRACRYLTGQSHRPDDLPYVAGPPRTSSTPYALNEDDPLAGDRTTSFMLGYELTGRATTTPDYGYDEQIQHYIYANGQSQEACRDQDHAMVGVGLLVDIAEIAWHQGDDLYGYLDNRILKGFEWAFRYNLSYVLDPSTAWEITGTTRNQNQVTLTNGRFLRIRSRSGRWESLAQSTKGRGDSFQAGGNRECALAHYCVRAGLDASSTQWTRRYRDYMIETYGCESYGKDANHAYEWAGWGTLTKRREPGMAGEPGRVESGVFVPAVHGVDCDIDFDDFDRPRYGAIDGATSRAAGSDESARTFTVTVPAAGRYAVRLNFAADTAPWTVTTPEGKTATAVQSTDHTRTAAIDLPAGPSAICFERPATAGQAVPQSFSISASGPSTGVDAPECDKPSIVGNKVIAPGARSIAAYDLQGRLVARSEGSELELPHRIVVIRCEF